MGKRSDRWVKRAACQRNTEPLIDRRTPTPLSSSHPLLLQPPSLSSASLRYSSSRSDFSLINVLIIFLSPSSGLSSSSFRFSLISTLMCCALFFCLFVIVLHCLALTFHSVYYPALLSVALLRLYSAYHLVQTFRQCGGGGVLHFSFYLYPSLSRVRLPT